VRLVQQYSGDGSLTQALGVLELARSTYYYQFAQKVDYEEKYAYLKQPLLEIARKHPGYGYRRATGELRESYGHEVNTKVVRNLHQCWEIALRRSAKRPRPSSISKVIRSVGKRANLVAEIENPRLFQILYTDFTELVYAEGRKKASLMPLIGHVSKIVAGWAVSASGNTELALEAWKRAKKWMKKNGIPVKKLIVHHDQDPVYTSHAWVHQLLVEDEARLSYALRGAKDNPEMESFIGRFKEENRSLLIEAKSLEEVREVVKSRLRYYNHERRHSSIGNTQPIRYFKKHRMGHTRTSH